MRFDRDRLRERLKEIAGTSYATLKRRPRLAFLSACLFILLVSYTGTQLIVEGVISNLPERRGPLSPLPMTEREIQEQIREAQDINERLRAQKAAERAWAFDRMVDGDSSYAPGQAYAGPDTRLPHDTGGRKDAPRPTEFVGTDRSAEPIYTVKAEFPDLARKSSDGGTVVVQALVGTDGLVHETRILKSIPALNAAAESAVRRWRFKPAESGGRPVATWVSVPVTFRR